jgi:hypothetical protein
MGDNQIGNFNINMLTTKRKLTAGWNEGLVARLNAQRVKKSEADMVLLWDMGAARHIFESMPDGGGHSVTNKGYRVLLGGSSKHAVRTASTFDIGLLRSVLLPDEVRIGYNIISAGQLHRLRTVQDTDGIFYLLNCVGDVISGGFIGQDNLFYLQDLNLLKSPGEILP